MRFFMFVASLKRTPFRHFISPTLLLWVLFWAMYGDCVDLFCFWQLFRLSGRAYDTPGY
jgi:hypothetical protein